MKVYGSKICGDCVSYKLIQEIRGFDAEYIEITESVAKLKEFLAIRDQDPIFDVIKESGAIGIPLFVREDGAKTFEINEALAWIGQPPVEEDEMIAPGTSCCENGCK